MLELAFFTGESADIPTFVPVSDYHGMGSNSTPSGESSGSNEALLDAGDEGVHDEAG